MSELRVRLAEGVRVEPLYGDIDVDCRLLFIGDRYRQLLRAYAEAIFRLSRDRSLADREKYLRSSAEIAQFYEITASDGKIALKLRDSVFFEQAPLDELDPFLVATHGTREVKIPLPLERFPAAGALMPLLNGELSEGEVYAALDAHLDAGARAWAREVLTQWSGAGFLERAAAAPNILLASPSRPRVTFMGHTSILLQSQASAVLTDPLYRVRFGSPRMAFDATRIKLGAICFSHSHWDHCDVATLLNFDKRTPAIVPRVRTPSAFNPPMVPMLKLLGFTDIREIDVWDRLQIDDIEIVAVPFHGEQDEPDAEIDHYTYVLRTKGLSVYGGVDAYRDTFGEMLPALERVRRDWAPDIAFLPISHMTYAWKFGGVNGFCRRVDTSLLDEWYQYTASPEQAVEWARALGARRVVPYATFNFSPLDVPAQSKKFEDCLKVAGLSNLLLPLRPFDAAGPDDLADTVQSAMRRRGLVAFLRASTAAKEMDKRLQANLGYRAVKRLLKGRAPSAAAHHH
jgi:L-ascorbate metabolism protein UlaG (beta-lactamase superfamily)